MPAEWEAHECCWMAWPCRHDLWPDIDNARQAYAKVANTIAAFEPVRMLARRDDIKQARALLTGDIEIIDCEIDDSWTRDTAPTFVLSEKNDSKELVAIDWRFNGWGEKFVPYQQDARMAKRIAELINVPCISSNLTAEGGAIHTNGEDTLLTTRQCLLNQNRNPGWTQDSIEQELLKHLGGKQVLWLERGLEDDHTDGHIDELACFVSAKHLLMLDTDDEEDANYCTLKRNQDIIRASQSCDGDSFNITRIHQPNARYLDDGSRMSLSYINFYLANHAVIMASFDQQEFDSNARQILAKCFPEREIIQLDAREIFVGGGGIHCITQQQPKTS